MHIPSQVLQEPRTKHWEAALRIVRRVNGSLGKGILFPRTNFDLTLVAYFDYD